MLVIAAAAALCLLLSVTALAAADIGAAYDILYAVAPEAAQRFQPVNLSCEDNGIVMEVMSAHIHDDTAEVYIALRDIEGGRVDETVDLFDSYSLNIPFDNYAHCERVGYDAQTHTAVFYIEIKTMNGEPIEGEEGNKIEKVTFRVRELLSGRREYEGELPAVRLDGVGEAADTVPVSELVVRSASMDLSAEYVSECLVPQTPKGLPVENVLLTGMGTIGGRLHIQLYFGDIRHTDAHGYVWFTDDEGNELQADQSVSFWDAQQNGGYEEYVFDISPEELHRLTLCGWLVTNNCLTEGSWKVTFPLTEAE